MNFVGNSIIYAYRQSEKALENHYFYQTVHKPFFEAYGLCKASNLLFQGGILLAHAVFTSVDLIEGIARAALAPIAALGLLSKNPSYQDFYNRKFHPFGVLFAFIAITTLALAVITALVAALCGVVIGVSPLLLIIQCGFEAGKKLFIALTTQN